MASLIVPNTPAIVLPSIVFVEPGAALSPSNGQYYTFGSSFSPQVASYCDSAAITNDVSHGNSFFPAASTVDEGSSAPNNIAMMDSSIVENQTDFFYQNEDMFDELLQNIDDSDFPTSEDSSNFVEELLGGVSSDLGSDVSEAFSPPNFTSLNPPPLTNDDTTLSSSANRIPIILDESFPRQSEHSVYVYRDVSSNSGEAPSPASSSCSSSSDNASERGGGIQRRQYTRIAPVPSSGEQLQVPKYLKAVRNPEKKKCQNRDAAHRYRSKKKGEFHAVEHHLSQLRQRKQEMEERVNRRRREVEYLENLLMEINSDTI